ncbi:radical SAM domain-containing protein [Klebsiella pneumoniae]|uniref:Radical SAM domain-containing protein n=1 Tax=Klebsiella pneumoniae TaxID=573 RepID=A0A3S4GFJ8_KLEPN|nr:radical SAM domain-containing protein [Klebsiella pneumoniae]
MQKHGERYIWINPPAIPLSTEEMDSVFALPYKRVPHPFLWRCAYSGV